MYPSSGYADRPGTLSLKSNMAMDYSRGVLSNKWHLKREAEPRDNELWSGCKPNLHQSTYKYLSKNVPSDRLSSETETKSKQEEAQRLLSENREHYRTQTKKEMVDYENKTRLEAWLKTDTLPKHVAGHDKHHLETTYGKDFTHPYPELIGQKSEKTLNHEFQTSLDNSMMFRRTISQFSDIDAPKRDGINTFHVQHGDYPNQVLKRQFFEKYNNKLFTSE